MKKIVLFLFMLCLSTNLFARQATGILLGENQVTIKAKSQGELKVINIAEGKGVKKGEAIAVIDDKKEKIELNLAEVEFETAGSDLLKAKELRKYISKEEITKKRNAYLKKKSIFDLKKYNYDNKRIISPITGIVAKRYYEIGETVSTGAKVYDVVVMDRLRIALDVMPRDTKELKIGQTLIFKTNLHKKREFKAVVGFIGPTIDPTSGTIKVRLKLANPRDKDDKFILRPGTFVIVEL